MNRLSKLIFTSPPLKTTNLLAYFCLALRSLERCLTMRPNLHEERSYRNNNNRKIDPAIFSFGKRVAVPILTRSTVMAVRS